MCPHALASGRHQRNMVLFIQFFEVALRQPRDFGFGAVEVDTHPQTNPFCVSGLHTAVICGPLASASNVSKRSLGGDAARKNGVMHGRVQLCFWGMRRCS